MRKFLSVLIIFFIALTDCAFCSTAATTMKPAKLTQSKDKKDDKPDNTTVVPVYSRINYVVPAFYTNYYYTDSYSNYVPLSTLLKTKKNTANTTTTDKTTKTTKTTTTTTTNNTKSTSTAKTTAKTSTKKVDTTAQKEEEVRQNLRKKYSAVLSNKTMSNERMCSTMASYFESSSYDELTYTLNTILRLNCDISALRPNDKYSSLNRY